MIRLRRVSKFFKIGARRTTVLNNLTIDIPTDRRLAVFGLPGSGKTTLLHLLAGLDEPDHGQIERHARLSFPVGYLKALKSNLSARQNLTFASRIYGADVEEVAGFIERVTEFGELMDEPLRRLPVQDRLAFACALTYAIPFDTYLIDTLFAAGSPGFRRKCLTMLTSRAETRGVIFVTSHRPIALRVCDAGAILADGQITLFDTIHEAAREFERLQTRQLMTRDVELLDDEYGVETMDQPG